MDIKEHIKEIIKESIYDMFGNDVTKQEELKQKKKKNSERSKKAALTKQQNKIKKEKEFNDNFDKARSYGDLFGNTPSDEERKKAEEYIQSHFKKRKK